MFKDIFYNTQALDFQPGSSESIQIEAGIIDRRQNFLYPNRTYGVNRVFVHPYYNLKSATSPHDLALLLLSRQIEFTAKGITAPIRIISLDDFDLEWSSLSVAGWGDTLGLENNRIFTFRKKLDYMDKPPLVHQ